MISLAFAETAAQPPAQPPEMPFFLHPIPLFVIIMIFFYFLMLRPQSQRAKAMKKMVAEIKKGDKIVTSSGFYATVVGVGETSLEIKIAENVKVKILKSAVSEVLGNQETAAPAPAAGEIKSI